VKSLSSSRREVLVDCFHVHACHISHLLPGSAVLQHSAALLHHIFSHNPATAAYASLLSRCCQPCARNENIKRDIYRAFLIAFIAIGINL
jgi:hypothetical protein